MHTLNFAQCCPFFSYSEIFGDTFANILLIRIYLRFFVVVWNVFARFVVPNFRMVTYLIKHFPFARFFFYFFFNVPFTFLKLFSHHKIRRFFFSHSLELMNYIRGFFSCLRLNGITFVHSCYTRKYSMAQCLHDNLNCFCCA